MNILLTGSSGYLGSHTCLELFKSDKIKRIYGVDVKDCPDGLKQSGKYFHLTTDIRSVEVKQLIKEKNIDVNYLISNTLK